MQLTAESFESRAIAEVNDVLINVWMPCVCVCLHAVAEKTTGAMGNIAAATGLVKKDEFPADMNVRTSTPVLSLLFLFPNVPL